jgi:FkbM family methyltransferase
MIFTLLPTREEISKRCTTLRRMSQRPTYLYGAGIYAEEMQSFLSSFGVPVSGHLVDPDRYRSVDTRIGSLDALGAIQPRPQIVIAYCGDPSQSRARLKSAGAPDNDVFPIDCRFWEEFQSLNYESILNRSTEYESLFKSLEDSVSRDTLLAYIRAKLTYDPTALQRVFSPVQYFPEDICEFQPRHDDVYVDCGAFDGDTLNCFLSLSEKGRCSEYYAFEPDADNCVQLSRMVIARQLEFAHVIRKGVWNAPDVLRFKAEGNTRSTLTDSGATTIQVETLDSHGIEATCIKMDVEGAELRALEGAATTIATYRPRLSIALYHNPEHLLDIPQFIHSLCPDYRFYLRIHSRYSEELVLYAATDRVS